MSKTRSLVGIIALAITTGCIHATAQQNDGAQINAKLKTSGNNESGKADNNQDNSSALPAAITPTPATTDSTPRTVPKTEPPNTKRDRFIDWLWRWLEPQNFSSLLLFVVGSAGIIIAIYTLNNLARQTDALVVMNSPYLDTSAWRGGRFGQASAEGLKLQVSFMVTNRGTTPAILSEVRLQSVVLDETFLDHQFPRVLLASREGHRITFPFGPVSQEAALRWDDMEGRPGLTMLVKGTLIFTNLMASKDSRRYSFERACHMFRESGFDATVPETGGNDEMA